MAFLGEQFSTDTLPEGLGSFEPLPPGWYSATITGADLCNTKAGTGQYIKLRFDITGPTHQGRVVFANLNIRNRNAQAETIGRQQFGDLLRSIGLESASDTDQLIGGQIDIKVSIRPGDGQYEAQNEVKGYRAIAGAPPVAAVAAPPAQEKAAASPPWAKR